MPRIARLHVPGVVLHVISRLVNGEFLIASDAIRHAYLDRVGAALTPTTWQLLAYAIMSNHMHLVFRSGPERLSSWIQSAHTSFATWLQRTRRRLGERALGPVFAQRPTTVLIEPERAAYVIAYVHNNPVRAAVASAASDSTWTSHRAYLGLTAAPRVLDVHAGLALSGFDPSVSGSAAFDAFVRSHAGQKRDPALSASNAAPVAAGVRQRLGSNVLLGTPELGSTGLRYPVVQSGSVSCRAPFVGPADQVLNLVATHTGVPLVKLISRGRCIEASKARRLAVVTWARLHRRPSEMAAAMAVSPSAVSQMMDEDALRPAARELLERILTDLLDGSWGQ